MGATFARLKNSPPRVLNAAIIGCGIIGTRRARLIQKSGSKVKVVVDLDYSRARELAMSLESQAEENLDKVMESVEIDVVIVATVNKDLASISLAALQSGKHVLCEKPAATSVKELEAVIAEAKRRSLCFGVGYNHRYHPGIWKAKELFEKGLIGRGISIRCRYGHGGRLGYEKEWRGNAELAGGGVLLDQGVHLVDLCRWFFGEFVEVSGRVSTDFWQIAPLEDNAWGILKSVKGETAMLHTSWTQWLNLFSFELFGSEGFVAVEGLGSSYGTERLKLWRRKKEFGIPELFIEEEYPGEDRSWELEWKEFASAVEQEREPLASGRDALEALRIIEAIYDSSKKGRVVRL